MEFPLNEITLPYFDALSLTRLMVVSRCVHAESVRLGVREKLSAFWKHERRFCARRGLLCDFVRGRRAIVNVCNGGTLRREEVLACPGGQVHVRLWNEDCPSGSAWDGTPASMTVRVYPTHVGVAMRLETILTDRKVFSVTVASEIIEGGDLLFWDWARRTGVIPWLVHSIVPLPYRSA